MCETRELEVWTAALNLPGYEVAHCAEDKSDGVLRLKVVPRQMVQLCAGCDRPCDSWHQKRWLENILDLPLGGRPVWLKVRVFQYRCEQCGRTWTPHSPIVAEGGARRLREWMAQARRLGLDAQTPDGRTSIGCWRSWRPARRCGSITGG